MKKNKKKRPIEKHVKNKEKRLNSNSKFRAYKKKVVEAMTFGSSIPEGMPTNLEANYKKANWAYLFARNSSYMIYLYLTLFAFILLWGGGATMNIVYFASLFIYLAKWRYGQTEKPELSSFVCAYLIINVGFFMIVPRLLSAPTQWGLVILMLLTSSWLIRGISRIIINTYLGTFQKKEVDTRTRKEKIKRFFSPKTYLEGNVSKKDRRFCSIINWFRLSFKYAAVGSVFYLCFVSAPILIYNKAILSYAWIPALIPLFIVFAYRNRKNTVDPVLTPFLMGLLINYMFLVIIAAGMLVSSAYPMQFIGAIFGSSILAFAALSNVLNIFYQNKLAKIKKVGAK